MTWSPYYKSSRPSRPRRRREPGSTQVNGVPHQMARRARAGCATIRCTACPIRDCGRRARQRARHRRRHGQRRRDRAEQGRQARRRRRDRPGSSTSAGAHHPDQPYQDPRVTTHVDDGRAFLERTERAYDLILFALPDSLALVTGAARFGWRATCSPSEALRVGARPPHAGRRLRDVQLLPRALAGRPLRRHRRGGVRPRALRRQVQREAGQAVSPSRVDERDQRVRARVAAPTSPASRRRPTTARSRTSRAGIPPLYLVALA